MLNFLQRVGVLRSKGNADFKIFPAVLMMLLMVMFIGTTVYVLVSSLQY